jgi:hypothetical protein
VTSGVHAELPRPSEAVLSTLCNAPQGSDFAVRKPRPRASRSRTLDENSHGRAVRLETIDRRH